MCPKPFMNEVSCELFPCKAIYIYIYIYMYIYIVLKYCRARFANASPTAAIS